MPWPWLWPKIVMSGALTQGGFKLLRCLPSSWKEGGFRVREDRPKLTLSQMGFVKWEKMWALIWPKSWEMGLVKRWNSCRMGGGTTHLGGPGSLGSVLGRPRWEASLVLTQLLLNFSFLACAHFDCSAFSLLWPLFSAQLTLACAIPSFWCSNCHIQVVWYNAAISNFLFDWFCLSLSPVGWVLTLKTVYQIWC